MIRSPIGMTKINKLSLTSPEFMELPNRVSLPYSKTQSRMAGESKKTKSIKKANLERAIEKKSTASSYISSLSKMQ